MRYHILDRPIKPGTRPNTAIWGCVCGIMVCLPIRPGTKGGTQIQVPDEQGNEIVECAGCYNGYDANRGQQNQPTVDNPTIPEEVNAPNQEELLDREGQQTRILKEEMEEECDTQLHRSPRPKESVGAFDGDGDPIGEDEVEEFGTGP